MSAEARESLYSLGEQLIAHRKLVLLSVMVTTLLFAIAAVRLRLVTRFDELLPQNHEFIQTHNQYASTFGGANTITLMIEVKDGTIFTEKTLRAIFDITKRLDGIHGVNHDLIDSLAHRSTQRIRLLRGMEIVEPVMGRVAKTAEEVALMRRIVRTSTNLYGVLVSFDEKATMMRATFIEGRLDHRRVFDEITHAIIEPFTDENTRIFVTGEVWLYGWVYCYAKEAFFIFLATTVLLWVLLYGYFHDIRGALRPTITGAISAIWGLGFISLIGFSLDPLTLVIPFFITARAVSHSVQMHDRYYEEYKRAGWRKEPAIIASFAELFVPTLSGILTDALGLLVILFVPIPFLQKLAVSATMWILAITVSELLLNPIVYFYLRAPDPRVIERREHGWLARAISVVTEAMLSPTGRIFTLASWGVVLLGSVYFWSDLVVGDPTATTSLLGPNEPYNTSHQHIQERFGGIEELIVMIERRGEQASLATPEVFHAIEQFQRYLERDPAVMVGISFVDVLVAFNVYFNGFDPKWAVLPRTERRARLLLSALFANMSYQRSSCLIDSHYRVAPIRFYCTDHKSETLKRIIRLARDYIHTHPLEAARFRLAGGAVGVLAAANEELLKNDALVNVLGFTTIFIIVVFTYRSWAAGLYLPIPLLAANAVVNAYMSVRHIGINVNTLPVVTVGVGFGIDYGFYIVSRFIEECHTGRNLREAVSVAVATAGKSVAFTALTMIVGSLLWTWSHLRFDAEMGLLLALWMGVSFLATVSLLPVIVLLYPPQFIVGAASRIPD